MKVSFLGRNFFLFFDTQMEKNSPVFFKKRKHSNFSHICPLTCSFFLFVKLSSSMSFLIIKSFFTLKVKAFLKFWWMCYVENRLTFKFIIHCSIDTCTTTCNYILWALHKESRELRNSVSSFPHYNLEPSKHHRK